MLVATPYLALGHCTTMRLLRFLCVVLVLREVRAFSTALKGVFGRCYEMRPVTCGMASKHVQKLEAEALDNRLPAFVAAELSRALELLSCSESDEILVTFIQEQDCLEPDYIVMYRKTDNTPTVYTIDALLATKDAQFSINVVERMLRQFCDENRGHLQMYPLKRWCGGRYANAMMLERSMFNCDD